MVALSSIQLDSSLFHEHKTAAAVIGGAAGLATLGYLYARSSGYKRSPSSFDISGGAVDAGKVKDTVRPVASYARARGA